MKGTLFGVGVGPGDPELMTWKAIRLIQENSILAFPGEQARETVAFQIASQAVPQLDKKTLLSLPMPMTHDQSRQRQAHEKAAQEIISYLEKGENVIFLTLGDPTIYSTYIYVHHIVKEQGYDTSLVNGIPSFCAVAAKAGISLCEGNEALHIIPSSQRVCPEMSEEDVYVFMKAGGKIAQVKDFLAEKNRDVLMMERCGMEGEHIYQGVQEIPDRAGYYSLIIAKPYIK